MKRPVDIIKELDAGTAITGQEAEQILAPLLDVLKAASVFAAYLYKVDKKLLASRPPTELGMYDKIVSAINSFTDKPLERSDAQLDA